MVNSSANIKPSHSKYTYYIVQPTYSPVQCLAILHIPYNLIIPLSKLTHTYYDLHGFLVESTYFSLSKLLLFFFNMIFFSSCMRHEKDFKKINDVSKLWTFLPNLYRFCENYVILRTKMLGSTYELLETLINSKSETHQGIIKT